MVASVESMRGLNLTTLKVPTVEVIQLPLWHKQRKKRHDLVCKVWTDIGLVYRMIQDFSTIFNDVVKGDQLDVKM
jgi:hypothetical protein